MYQQSGDDQAFLDCLDEQREALDYGINKALAKAVDRMENLAREQQEAARRTVDYAVSCFRYHMPAAGGGGGSKQQAADLEAAGPKDIEDWIVTAPDLMRECPEMRAPVIEGLLRHGEVMNLIAAPKIGKSWLTLGLAAAVSTGIPWLGRHTTQGRVLVIDNELHMETLASRLRRVCQAYGISGDCIDIMRLRGRLVDLEKLGARLRSVEPGCYRLVAIDAFYRTLPLGVDENDNAAMAGMYNVVDRLAAHLDASIVLVHHSTKGAQGEKAITDVGSGAGSMARAADTHCILRLHEEDDHVVMEAVTRSWQGPAPCVLRWEWPCWRIAHGNDPTAIRSSRPRKRKPEGGEGEGVEGGSPAAQTWTPERFAGEIGRDEPQSKDAIILAAAALQISERQAERLFRVCAEKSLLHEWKTKHSRITTYARIPQPSVSEKVQKNASGKRQKPSKLGQK